MSNYVLINLSIYLWFNLSIPIWINLLVHLGISLSADPSKLVRQGKYDHSVMGLTTYLSHSPSASRNEVVVVVVGGLRFRKANCIIFISATIIKAKIFNFVAKWEEEKTILRENLETNKRFTFSSSNRLQCLCKSSVWSTWRLQCLSSMYSFLT